MNQHVSFKTTCELFQVANHKVQKERLSTPRRAHDTQNGNRKVFEVLSFNYDRMTHIRDQFIQGILIHLVQSSILQLFNELFLINDQQSDL